VHGPYSTGSPRAGQKAFAVRDPRPGSFEEETFLTVLEKWLNDLPAPSRRYEVLNFAVPGYNTAIEVAAFEHRVLSFEPDLVVIHFVNNDWGVPKFMQRRPDPLSLRRSYFLDLLLARLGVATGEGQRRLIGFRLEDVATEEERNEIKSRYHYMTNKKGYRRAMDHLAELADEWGIPVVVLIGSTRRGQMRVIRGRVKEHDFNSVSIGPVTDRILAEYGIPNDRMVLRRKMQVAPGDPHPNGFGHYIYAVGLWEKLQEMGVIPPSPTPSFPAGKLSVRP